MNTNPVSHLIDAQEGRVFANYGYRAKPQPIREQVFALVNAENARNRSERRTLPAVAWEVMRRELNEHHRLPDAARNFAVLRGVSNFLAAQTYGPDTKTPTRHTDLLNPGNPLSTTDVKQALTASALRTETARWYAAHPDLPEDARPLIAAAFRTEPGSVEAMHAYHRLHALRPGTVPAEILAEVDSRIQIS